MGKMFSELRVATLLAACAGVASSRVTCDGSFKPISASDFTAALQPGWNPGNTLDAIPDETSWGNPVLVSSTFANVKRIGFKGIRLPVTYADHMLADAPYTIDAKWIQRVSDVLDMITSNGLYVMVNVHHDSWRSFDFAAANANYTKYEDMYYSMWHQIGEKLACKSSMVAFEALNEPAGSTAEHAAELNKLNNVFLKAITDAGGFNAQRVVVLCGLGDNAVNMVQWLEIPKNMTNPLALTFHYYSPWDFIALAWGKTVWGSDADKATLDADFAAVRGNYTDIPIIVGEFGLEVRATETAARWKWFDQVARAGYKNKFAMMLWDASIHFVENSSDPWEDTTALNIFLQGSKGVNSTLADSTEDGSASEQWTSAYIWHRSGERGEPVTDQNLPFILNGNSLKTIQSITSNGTRTLNDRQDYAVSGSNITFKTRYLSTLFSPNGTQGIKANLTLHFSAGADLHIQAVQWDTPQPSKTDVVINTENVKNDLSIPFEFKGLNKVATVKARMYNGTFLLDDWTQWLGPLQQGRLTYQSHFDWNANNVIVKSSVLQAALKANIATGLTFEFYPRVQANAVNFTLNVVAP